MKQQLPSAGPFARYATTAIAAGCPKDQLRNLLRAGVVLQPRQLCASAAARLCDNPNGPTEVGFGGARGGGKSHWLLAQMGADDCQRLPGLKCLLLRKVGKANLEHFEDLRRTVLAELPHEFAAYRGVLTFANGSRIVAGHFQSESDIDSYLGLEYDVIGVEEATTLSSSKYEHITTCCRTSKVLPRGGAWRPRIYSTTNPGGIGHDWYYRRFVLPYLERSALAPKGPFVEPISSSAVVSAKRPYLDKAAPSTIHHQPSTVFIPATVSDNAFNNPEYRRILENLHGWQRRAWLNGDWDIAAGQFFTNWRSAEHVVSDFDPKRAVEWWAALDYGFTHYTVVLLGARDGDGRIFVVDEHAQRLWLPQRHAAAIKAMLARQGLKVQNLRRFVAGEDVFSRQSDGTTVAAQYARLGINLRPANMQRINGWAEILARLGDREAGIEPTLFLHARCRRLIGTMPVLQHDPGRPEDVLKVDANEDGYGGDDAADALRYLVATMPVAVGMAVA